MTARNSSLGSIIEIAISYKMPRTIHHISNFKQDIKMSARKGSLGSIIEIAISYKTHRHMYYTIAA